MITFDSDSESPFVSYALRLIRAFCGVQISAPDRSGRTSRSRIDVYHGNDLARACSIRIPLLKRYSRDDVPIASSDDSPTYAPVAGAPFPFDLFSAMRFWLADEANELLPENVYDQHDRLISLQSVQESLGVREIPIVNSYLDLFGKWLRARLGAETRPPWGEGKRCAVVLSHDVDSPVNPWDPRHALWAAWKAATAIEIRSTAKNLVAALRRMRRVLRGFDDRHWLFHEIMEVERGHGFRSTFFLSSRPRDSQGANPSFDVDYDVRSPGFRAMCRDILAQGFGIGLHISYNARENWREIDRERQTLEAAAGTEVRGSRHHYWHMKRPFWTTLQDHGRAGLRYDSSIAFNDDPGYRLGIAFPFHPWNPISAEPASIVEVPAMVMDGALLYGQKGASGEPLRQMARLLTTLKRFQGAAAIDWHVRTSYPGARAYQGWGQTYLDILTLLASDREIRVLTYEDILADSIVAAQK